MWAELRFLAPYYRTARRSLSWILVTATVSVFLEHLIPWMLRVLIDQMKVQIIQPSVFLLVGLTITVFLVGWLGRVQRVKIAYFAKRIEQSLRAKLFQKVVEQPKQFFDTQDQGDLLTRLVTDLDKVQELVGTASLHLYRTLLTLVLSTLFLLLLSPLLALIGFAFFVILALASLRLIQVIYAGQRKIQEDTGVLTSALRQSFLGIEMIKANAAEAWMSNLVGEHSRSLRNSSVHVSQLSSLIWPSITLLCGAGIGLAIWIGMQQVHAGQLTVGSLAAAVIYLVRAQYPLVGLGIMAAIVQRGRASLNRIMELDAKTPEELSSQDILPKAPLQSMEFRHITIQYPDQKPVIQDVSLQLTPGKKIGICGPVGSGKTSLAKGLCGITPMAQGQVFLNGMELTPLQSCGRQLNRYFTMAPQDGFLFSWSIAQNTAMEKKADQNRIEQALIQAGLENELKQMEKGMDTLLGERGVNLSGGQRQRVGLARALYHEAPVLILDDVMSSLDAQTEHQIIQSLLTLSPQLCLILISHRYHFFPYCDEVIFLQEGRIAERGLHQDLIGNPAGLYYRQWTEQMTMTDGAS